MATAPWRRAAAITALVLVVLALPNGRAVAAPRGAGLLRLLSQSTAVEPGGDLSVRVQSTTAPVGAQLRLTMYGRAVTRSGFQQTLTGRSLGRPLAPPVVVPAQLDTAGTISVTIHTSGSQPPSIPMATNAEGVFPLTIELLDAAAKPLDQVLTYVVRLPVPDDSQPLHVSVIVPMGGDPLLQPDGSVVASDAVRASFVERGAVLDSHPGVPVTIDASPESLTSLGRDDKDVATALQQAASGRQVAATSYVAVDTSSWLAAGLDGELALERSRGNDALRAGGIVPSSTTAIADRPLTTTALRWLRDSGARNVVVPDGGLSPLDGRRFPATLTQPFHVQGVDQLTVAVADPALSQHLQDSGDPVVAANHLLADLAILYFDQPKLSRVAIVDLPAAVSPTALDAILAGLATTRVLHASTLDDALAAVPLAGSRGQPDGGSDPLVRTVDVNAAPATTLATRMRTTEADLGSYRDCIDDGGRAAALQERLLVGGASALSEDRQRSYLDAVVGTIHDELRRVEAPRRQVITFTARDGVVSFIVRNGAGYPIRVVVHLEGTKLEIRDHPSGALPVTLADETTRVSINVHTLASGDSPLDVTITTPDGRLELGRTRIIVRSTAFSGVGIVLSVGAGLFLLVWWGRHILLTRRAGRAATRTRHPIGR